MIKVAVLGVGRSGTTRIYKILQDILYYDTGDRLDCVYEPFLWDRKTFDRPYELVVRSFENIDALSNEGIYYHKKLPLFIPEQYDLSGGPSTYIKDFSTPLQKGNSLLIKLIRANGRFSLLKQCTPDLKSIFIIRNPIDVINSIINLFSFYGDDFYSSDFPRLIIESSKGLIQPLPRIDSTSRVQREFLYWYTMNKYFLERYSTDENVLVICYENYIKEEKKWIAKICSFLDIDLKSRYLENLDLPTGYVSAAVNIDFDDYSFLKPFAYDYMKMLQQHNVSTKFDIDQILMKYEDRTLSKRLDLESQGKGPIFFRKLDLIINEKERENLAFRNTIQSKSSEIAEKERFIEEKERENLAFRNTIQSKSNEIAEKERFIEEKERENLAFRNTIQSKSNEIAEKERFIEEKERENLAFRNTIQSKSNEIVEKERFIEEKERENLAFRKAIQSKSNEIAEKERFIEEKERENLASRNTIQSLKEKLFAKDKVIGEQMEGLVAKERVIRSLVRYRKFSILYWFVCLKKPLFVLNKLLYGLRKTKTIGTLEWICVEFFSADHSEHLLYQHDPVPLRISKHYNSVTGNPGVDNPVVSIVTPSFNQGSFLERTLKSVFNQRYFNLEYIIQDGGSSDNTLQIVEQYRSQFKHVASERDQGQAQAINLGFRHASGDIMAWLNSDDLILPGTIAYVVNYFSHHPEVDVVYGHRINIDEKDHEIGCRVMPSHNEEILKWVDYIPQETLFWRKSIWEKVGGQLDESFRFALDWDLLLRFQKAGANIVRLPRFLGAFRVHAAQKTSSWHEIGRQEVNTLRRKVHGREVSEMEVRRHIKAYVRRLAWYKLMYRFKLIRH